VELPEAVRLALLLGVAVALVAAGCGSTKTVTVTNTVTTVRTVTTTKTPTAPTTTQSGSAAACTGDDLQASFSAIAGSAGAGQIGYELTLTNTSAAACSVSGVPVGTLLDKTEGALQTQISTPSAGPAGGTVVLQHGQAAKADARFSPDVPGVGEQQTGRCEPIAYFLRVTAPGGGTVNAAIAPPTSVCEHGSLSFAPFSG
jgi:uncharacterized protein DUF4232